MSASSAFPTRRFPLGKVVANAAQTTPHATPAKPKTRNGAATPAEVASIAGAARRPTMLPLWNPPMHAATARLRSRFGTHRAIRLFMHGSATPSPRPIAARTISKAGRECDAAKGVHAVARLQRRMPPRRTALPP